MSVEWYHLQISKYPTTYKWAFTINTEKFFTTYYEQLLFLSKARPAWPPELYQ